jgi:hypothetical protein
VVQSSHTREDRTRALPDVIIHLPGGRSLVIDSKVSLLAYEEFAVTVNESQRTAAGEESGSGAPTLGSGGWSTAFAVALSPAAIISFPAAATSNVVCGFPRTTLTCGLHAAGYETWPSTMHNAGPYGAGNC